MGKRGVGDVENFLGLQFKNFFRANFRFERAPYTFQFTVQHDLIQLFRGFKLSSLYLQFITNIFI